MADSFGTRYRKTPAGSREGSGEGVALRCVRPVQLYRTAGSHGCEPSEPFRLPPVPPRGQRVQGCHVLRPEIVVTPARRPAEGDPMLQTTDEDTAAGTLREARLALR